MDELRAKWTGEGLQSHPMSPAPITQAEKKQRFFFVESQTPQRSMVTWFWSQEWDNTYEDNFSCVLNQEFPFFWFTSSRFCKQPVSFEVLAPASLFLQGSHMQREYRKRTTLRSKSSTSKGLLYAPDPDNCKKGMLSDQPRLLRVSSTALLCCWG